RAGSLLVVAEVAVAVVLLVGAGLMIRSFSRLLSVDTGYDSRGLLTGRLILTASSYPEPPRVQSFFDTLLSRLEALPGVEAAAAVSQLPLSGPFSSGTIAVEDRQADPDNSDVETDQIVVAGDYFRTMGIALLSGRYFTAADAAGAPGVAIVDEMMARRFWPDSDPVGRRIKFGSLDSVNPWLTIVGVVRHIKNTDLDTPGREQTYTPLAQRSTRGMSVVIRAASDAGGPGGAADAAQLAGPLREAVLAIDPQQPIFSVQTMDEVVDAEVAEPRFSMLLLLLFAGIAAALAAIGIYGMMAWSVTQRNHEIAIRMALGAQRPDVLRMVLAQGLRLTLAGVLFGLAGAFALTRTMSSLLFDVSALDPATYVAVALLLALVAMAAVWVPARRATRADPMIALRYE
ncbi:MAG TPA: ABC transporter permease, partial [Candidatus Polarisedimenticolia bacterium]|nr:ABC transporter permease [Candidatus Polarisedimenticolia bacterium]